MTKGKLDEQKQLIEIRASQVFGLEKISKVDSKGGLIELGDSSLTIPSGSLCDRQDVSITLENPVQFYGVFDDVGLFPCVVIASPAVKLGPSGLQFSRSSFLEAKSYRQARDDEEITVVCGSYVEDENGVTKVMWEDVTNQCRLDGNTKNCESISVEIHHFSWYIVLYKSVVINTKALLSRLNLTSFKYHMAIFIKRDYPHDSYCDLRVVFMSSDIYRESSYSHKEGTILTRLTEQGYKRICEREGSYVYSGQELNIRLIPGAACRLGPQEDGVKNIAVNTSSWWSSGDDVSFTLRSVECTGFPRWVVEVEDELHTLEVKLNDDELIGYLQSAFQIGEVANLGPLAEDLQVTAEEMQFLVSSSWKDDKQQFEELVKLGLSKNVEESTVKLALHNRSKTKELRVNRRGQMHVVNLRNFKETSDGVHIHEVSHKQDYLDKIADQLLKSFLRDCCIQTVTNSDEVESIELGQHASHLHDHQYITIEVSRKLQHIIPETPGNHRLVAGLVPILIQVAKDSFAEVDEVTELNGMWGLSDKECKNLRTSTEKAMENNEESPLLVPICEILAQLCTNNLGYLTKLNGINNGVINDWRGGLEFRDLLKALDRFMKQGDGLRMKIRILSLRRNMSSILTKAEHSTYRVRNLSNLAFCLLDFARFVPSRLVSFRAVRGNLTIQPEDVVREDKLTFLQEFLVERESTDQVELLCSVVVNIDGEMAQFGYLKAEINSPSASEMHAYITSNHQGHFRAQVTGATPNKLFLLGTNEKELSSVLNDLKRSYSCETTGIEKGLQLKVVNSGDPPKNLTCHLTLFYHWGDEGISYEGKNFKAALDDHSSADREETSGLLSKQSQAVVSQNGPHDIEGSRQVTSVVTSSSDQMNTYREVKPGETANEEVDAEQSRPLVKQDAPCEAFDGLLSTGSARQIASTVTSALGQVENGRGSSTQIVVVLQDQRQITKVKNNQDQRQVTVNNSQDQRQIAMVNNNLDQSQTTVKNQQTYKSEVYGTAAIGDQSSINTTQVRNETEK